MTRTHPLSQQQQQPLTAMAADLHEVVRAKRSGCYACPRPTATKAWHMHGCPDLTPQLSCVHTCDEVPAWPLHACMHQLRPFAHAHITHVLANLTAG